MADVALYPAIFYEGKKIKKCMPDNVLPVYGSLCPCFQDKSVGTMMGVGSDMAFALQQMQSKFRTEYSEQWGPEAPLGIVSVKDQMDAHDAFIKRDQAMSELIAKCEKNPNEWIACMYDHPRTRESKDPSLKNQFYEISPKEFMKLGQDLNGYSEPEYFEEGDQRLFSGLTWDNQTMTLMGPSETIGEVFEIKNEAKMAFMDDDEKEQIENLRQAQVMPYTSVHMRTNGKIGYVLGFNNAEKNLQAFKNNAIISSLVGKNPSLEKKEIEDPETGRKYAVAYDNTYGIIMGTMDNIMRVSTVDPSLVSQGFTDENLKKYYETHDRDEIVGTTNDSYRKVSTFKDLMDKYGYKPFDGFDIDKYNAFGDAYSSDNDKPKQVGDELLPPTPLSKPSFPPLKSSPPLNSFSPELINELREKYGDGSDLIMGQGESSKMLKDKSIKVLESKSDPSSRFGHLFDDDNSKGFENDGPTTP